MHSGGRHTHLWGATQTPPNFHSPSALPPRTPDRLTLSGNAQRKGDTRKFPPVPPTQLCVCVRGLSFSFLSPSPSLTDFTCREFLVCVWGGGNLTVLESGLRVLACPEAGSPALQPRPDHPAHPAHGRGPHPGWRRPGHPEAKQLPVTQPCTRLCPSLHPSWARPTAPQNLVYQRPPPGQATPGGKVFWGCLSSE